MLSSTLKRAPKCISTVSKVRASSTSLSAFSTYALRAVKGAARQAQPQMSAPVFLAASKHLQNERSPFRFQSRSYADQVVKVPSLAESITEGTLKTWIKKVGDFVHQDEEVASIETDKVDIAVNSPVSGTILEVFAQEEDNIEVGADLFKIELGDAPAEGAAKPEAPKEEPKKTEPKKETPPPQAEKPKAAEPTPQAPKPSQPQQSSIPPAATSGNPQEQLGAREERRVKMSRMRLRISERLKESQNVAASLTTFNEIDMSNLMNMRSQYKDAVLKQHGIKLGFMSAFVKATTQALQAVPAVNAIIEGNDIVYRDYCDVSVAVATPKGLVTPVLRNADKMSFIDVEKTIFELGQKARDNKITIEDMAGGTFTISNGGVFGSLMGTPIINMPQAAILGMHAIKERAVVVNGKVESRPMMYVALTYDHRIIDGREAVTFLVKLKEAVEDPRRLLLNV
ncbi:dihydrolipoamide succinyltransferase [Basidiobolus meristosporus CBS 931.73]|uniref:dihydrolipoyllysine-residue succinyltransferase n=1 Tax=Basidiobolus meristosporus CBS 931.73 TaxID=1314790 RepID=A0A1Y1XQ27_9FUNG|nr:dihydrolipoamide succinyltransferase [Basidiobolus meristosporus CBS 931.73]|eukprot:ORX87847.1 dihydrolipoamide succinyltransferase [Basidiobolus meristosporus CBS 931.73]